ncbi:MAG: CocE/NonD family hydrolase [Actinomycetota bacterium]
MTTREHVSIEMGDGVRLAATLYMPESADGSSGPWPAVLEALPYRKDDVTGHSRSEYRRLAEAGYVLCRVDVRGTGSSEGIATDEYPTIERTDLMTVIDWLATQPWSLGTVGMYGYSYSGFNSIQLGMERPPALKAIIPIYATDDRYGDDVHYYGGVVKQLDQIDYPTYMVAMNALPPVPSVYGDGWREEWTRRLEGTEPWVLTWLEHQRLDGYWKAGSLFVDYEAIECPTMIVAGWADGYRNNSLRTFERLRCPKRLVIGPWAHAATDTSLPGPNHDLIPEHIRWWDRWLKGVDNGIDHEPPIVLFAQRSTLPAPDRAEVRGQWRYEPTWPAERLSPIAWPLATAEANRPGDGPDELDVRGDVGHTAWISCAGVLPWGQPDDQRPDELHSLTYTWEPLERELEILGHARLRARVTSTSPVAFLSAKLCDVFPDGTSSLVARGMLNLTHRDSREHPSPLAQGEPIDVELVLEVTSWTFEPGHRVRLDLAGTDWPNAWAPPTPLTLTIDRASASLELPMLDGPSPVTERPPFPPSNVGDPEEREEREDADPADGVRWSVTHEVLTRITSANAGSTFEDEATPDVPAMRSHYDGSVSVSTNDPGRAIARGEAEFEMRWDEATVVSRVDVAIESDADAFHTTIDLVVREDGAERFRRRWERAIPRDLA